MLTKTNLTVSTCLCVPPPPVYKTLHFTLIENKWIMFCAMILGQTVLSLKWTCCFMYTHSSDKWNKEMNDHKKSRLDGQQCKMEQCFKVLCSYLVCIFTYYIISFTEVLILKYKTVNLDFQLTLVLPALWCTTDNWQFRSQLETEISWIWFQVDQFCMFAMWLHRSRTIRWHQRWPHCDLDPVNTHDSWQGMMLHKYNSSFSVS